MLSLHPERMQKDGTLDYSDDGDIYQIWEILNCESLDDGNPDDFLKLKDW
jgi:hypothetical protein